MSVNVAATAPLPRRRARSSTTARNSSTKPGPFATAARTLTEAGMVVIPCGKADGKAPLVKWAGLDQPLAPEKLNGWLRYPRFATANIGIATGPSGLTVIDCDTPNALDRVIERFGPTPVIVATPRGGYHLYYKANGERSGPIREDGLAIDVRARGGFVVAPPSVRRTGEFAGKSYAFVAGDWADLPSLPHVLEGALDRKFYGSDTGSPDTDAPAGRAPAETGKDVGRRNRTLFDHLRRVARDVGSRTELMEAAEAFNARFDPPLAATEVYRTTESVWNYREQGRLFAPGQSSIVIPAAIFDRLAKADNGADAFLLLGCLIHNHGAGHDGDRSFVIVPTAMMRENVVQGWGKTRYRNAIRTLLSENLITLAHRGGRRRGDPHRYEFATVLGPAKCGDREEPA